MFRVFICGAQSTGKTTLLKTLVSERTQDLHPVNEIARNIIAENGWQRKDFEPTTRPATFYDLQVKILRAQSQIDEELCNQNRSYISDRGLDPIIYCQMYLGEDWFQKIIRTKEAGECIRR